MQKELQAVASAEIAAATAARTRLESLSRRYEELTGIQARVDKAADGKLMLTRSDLPSKDTDLRREVHALLDGLPFVDAVEALGCVVCPQLAVLPAA